MSEDKCILCLSDINEESEYSYKPCPVCNIVVCGDCIEDIYEKQRDEQCPQCKNQLIKPKYFFAGKMDNLDPDIRRYCFKDESIIKEFTKKNRKKFKKDDIIGISKFTNKNIQLPNIDKTSYQITGPTSIINTRSAYEVTEDIEADSTTDHQYYRKGTLIDLNDFIVDSHSECLQESWFVNPIENPDKNISSIILDRCQENISQCDVFSLHINDDTDCYASLREFGIAEALGKTLLIYTEGDWFSKNIKLKKLLGQKMPMLTEYFIDEICLEHYRKEIKQFHMFKNRVIDSLNKIKSKKRDLYIKLHPKIPCYDYEEYLEYLNNNL